jgi:hypothetical protein
MRDTSLSCQLSLKNRIKARVLVLYYSSYGHIERMASARFLNAVSSAMSAWVRKA